MASHDSSVLDSDIGSRTGPRLSLHALIFGINEYASREICDLKGAVPDAMAIKAYLEKDLGALPSQIRLLRDAEATRSGIIQAFHDLITNQSIRRDDPILIFFAGHGGEADAPNGWVAGDPKIQMLIPHDFNTLVDGRVVHGIPIRRTIGTLLSRVAHKWGDNIVRLCKLYTNA